MKLLSEIDIPLFQLLIYKLAPASKGHTLECVPPFESGKD